MAAKDLGWVWTGQVRFGWVRHNIVGLGVAAKYLGQVGNDISRSGPAGKGWVGQGRKISRSGLADKK